MHEPRWEGTERVLGIVALPALASMIGASTIAADAADNKKQFHYQDKAAISSNGWCIAWAKK